MLVNNMFDPEMEVSEALYYVHKSGQMVPGWTQEFLKAVLAMKV